jgi:isovaleryl-CoA dehydrogenase
MIMLANAPRPFNFDLGETAEAIRETVRDFSQEQIAPLASKIDREDWFPRHLWPEMGALGLHGVHQVVGGPFVEQLVHRDDA